MKKHLKSFLLMLVLIPCALLFAACSWGPDFPEGEGDPAANMCFTIKTLGVGNEVDFSIYKDEDSVLLEIAKAGDESAVPVVVPMYFASLFYNENYYTYSAETKPEGGLASLTAADWTFVGNSIDETVDAKDVFDFACTMLSYNVYKTGAETGAAQSGDEAIFELDGTATVAGQKCSIINAISKNDEVIMAKMYVTKEGYVMKIEGRFEEGEGETAVVTMETLFELSSFKLNPSKMVNVNELPVPEAGE